MSWKTAAVTLLAVCVATAGQLTLKAGMSRVGAISTERLGRPVDLALQIAKTPLVIVGLGLFVVSAAFWMFVLSRVPLSYAYPFVGFTYVLIALFGRFVLHERVPALRWAGIALIVAGILVIGNTSEDSPRADVRSRSQTTSNVGQ
ncbi:MAG: EamA family transporter [Actinomycetota bacterium]|nr:EamA family transporter [Actinomycetota bacterium]